MSRWQTFLNSLNTPGGNLFTLALFVIALFFAVIHVLETPHPDSEQTTTVIISTFSAFTGALLQALRGRTSDIAAATKNGSPPENNDRRAS